MPDKLKEYGSSWFEKNSPNVGGETRIIVYPPSPQQ